VEVLRAAATGKEILACLKEARGFDSEFHAALAISEREDALATLRARWRSVGALPEFQSSLTPALVQTGIGIVVAATVIAMYLPIFKLASLL
jgi:type II secretory pathway component PulF